MRQKNHTFSIIIGVISLLTIYKIVLHPFDIFGIASVIVGMTGIALYYKDNRKYDSFFYAWVFMQLPNIFLINNLGLETSIINAFPSSIIPVNLGVGLNLGLKGNSNLTIYLNLLPIGLYFLLKYFVPIHIMTNVNKNFVFLRKFNTQRYENYMENHFRNKYSTRNSGIFQTIPN